MEALVHDHAVAGERYMPEQMGMLDSGRPCDPIEERLRTPQRER